MIRSASPAPYAAAVSISVPPASTEHLQQGAGLLGGRVATPGHGAEAEPGHPQSAGPDRAYFHDGKLPSVCAV